MGVNVSRRRKKPAKDATQLEIYRYDAGLTLDDLADQTRIPQRHLHALEARELEKLPAPVFISGYLRNLAEFFEVEIDLLLSDYDFSQEENLVASLQPASEFSNNQPSLTDEIFIKISNYYKYLSGPELLEGSKKRIIAISIFIVILLITSIFFLAGKNNELSASESKNLIINQNLNIIDSKITSSQKKTLNFGRISIKVNESSWIELNDAQEKLLFRDLARKGQILEFFAPLPFELLLGYAPGVNITLNGKEFTIENIREDNSSRLIIQP